MPAGTTWGLVRVHFWSCTSHTAPPSALPSQVCVFVCACPPVSVHVWPSLESLCLSSYYMAEKHRDQTLRRELHKRHSGARTPCFHSAASRYWKTDLRVGKWERKSGRRADVCVSVCVCAWQRSILQHDTDSQTYSFRVVNYLDRREEERVLPQIVWHPQGPDYRVVWNNLP